MHAWRRKLLVHPASVLAVAVLCVNDGLLKSLHPGLITGKLSDVAGVWMVAAVLTALFGNRWLGVVAAGLGFTCLKLSPFVAELARPVLGGRTLTDATDLVALVVLPAVWLLARGVQHDQRADRARSLTYLGAVCVVAASVVSTTATSCDTEPEVAELRVAGDGGTVFVRTSHDADWYAFSADGVAIAAPHAAAAARSGSTTGCADNRCFTVRPDEGLYEGTTLVYSLTDADRERLADSTSCLQEKPFLQMVVRGRGRDAEVVVAMGMAGLVSYRLADDSIRQLSVPGFDPVGLDGIATEGANFTRVADHDQPSPWLRWAALIGLAVAFVIGLFVAVDWAALRGRRGA